MNKFKAFFEISIFSGIPHEFIDQEVWIEFESEHLELAELDAFRSIAYELIEVNNNVLRKIELIKIKNIDSDNITYYNNDE